jgi:hypothetical protein
VHCDCHVCCQHDCISHGVLWWKFWALISGDEGKAKGNQSHRRKGRTNQASGFAASWLTTTDGRRRHSGWGTNTMRHQLESGTTPAVGKGIGDEERQETCSMTVAARVGRGRIAATRAGRRVDRPEGAEERKRR